MTPKEWSVSAQRHYRTRQSVTRIFAAATGRTLGGAHQMLYGPDAARLKMMRFIQLAHDQDLHDWARGYVAPIDKLFRESPAAYGLTLIRQESEREGRENLMGAIAQYTNHETDLLAWAKALEEEARAELHLADSLRMEVARRKANR